jgi:hypothetical protein
MRRRECASCGLEEPTYISTAWCPRGGYHVWIEAGEAERRKKVAARLPRLRALASFVRTLGPGSPMSEAVAEAIELLTDECEAARVAAKGRS